MAQFTELNAVILGNGCGKVAHIGLTREGPGSNPLVSKFYRACLFRIIRRIKKRGLEWPILK